MKPQNYTNSRIITCFTVSIKNNPNPIPNPTRVVKKVINRGRKSKFTIMTSIS